MKLKESYTVLMMPFSIDTERWRMPHDGLWQPAEMKVEGDALHSHIQDWMQAGACAATRERIPRRDYNYEIYSIRPTADDDDALKTRVALWRKAVAKRWRLAKKGIDFQLVNKDTELLSTKLLVNTLAGVGLLIVTVQLAKADATVNDLMELNYAIHKTDRQTPAIVPAADLDVIHPRQAEDYRLTTAALGGGGDEAQWTMNNLIDLLMADVAGAYTRFNRKRLHVFTYYRAERGDEAWEQDFMHIVRCENENYEVSVDHDRLLRPFSNIVMGAAVEGGAIMTLSTPQDDDPTSGSNHIRNFGTTSLQKRYLWIYIMAVLQRHTLRRMSHELSTIDPLAQEDTSLQQLQRLLERMATLKATTYFTEVSDFTHHNEYYTYVVERLGIKAAFDDIDEKMELLRTVVENRKSEREEAKNDRLTIILAILTVASATCDALAVITDEANRYAGIGMATALAALILFIWTRKSRS